MKQACTPAGRFKGLDRAIIIPRLIAEIDRQLDDLSILLDDLRRREEASIERRKIIAHVPDDSPSNRLLLRYMKDAHSEFHRSFKLLEKVQSDRKKEAQLLAKASAAETRKAISRNEPEQTQGQETKRTCDAPADAGLGLTEQHVIEILMDLEGNVPDDVRADIEAVGFGYLLPLRQAA